MENELIAQYSKLPTYLVDLLPETNVLLVYSKKKENMETSSVTNTADDTICNLTGTPLQVDLDVLSVTNLTSHQENKEELQHLPMTLRQARKYINNYNQNQISKRETIVCICDGSDKEQTVAVASSLADSYFTRMLICADGYLQEANLENKLDSMLQYHIEQAEMGSHKVVTQVSCTYELYGYQLYNYHLDEHIENVGSAFLESSWSLRQYNIPKHGATIQLMLQVVVGHENSVVYNLYEELEFLQNCLKKLSNNHTLEETSLCSNPVESRELSENLTTLFHTVQLLKLPVMSEAPTFEYATDPNFTDKLWSILKRCGNVKDLQNCFPKLFSIIQVQMLEDDKDTMIGRAIQEVYSGRMLIPNLSAKQCLELFIELGIKKLKKSYFSIIKSFDFQIAKDLQVKWDNISLSEHEPRRVAITELNISHVAAQLQFLLQIHILIQFLELAHKKCCLSKEICISVLNNGVNKYMMKDFTDSLIHVNTEKLCDIIVPVAFADIELKLSNDNLSKWKLKLSSNSKQSSVITTFHYSKKPIFPSTIYKYDDLNESTLNKCQRLYGVRLEVYADKV